MKTNPTLGMIIVLMICAIAVHISCDKEALVLGEKWLGISGTVVDSITGLAVDSARISLQDTLTDYSIFTDSTGFYKAPALSGTMTVFARKSNYATQWRTLQIRADTTGVDFELVPE